MRNFALLILLLLSATASAEPSSDHPYALSVNSPLSWVTIHNVGASGYVGLTDHQALRLNVASYDFDVNVIGHLALGDVDGNRFGRLLDVGAGWMYFPRHTYDGLMFELGVLRRAGHTKESDSNMDPYFRDRDTQLYAARAMIGWSWLIHNRVMVSLAAGAARGYEFGAETTTRDGALFPDYMPRSETHDVAQWTTTVEGYFRVGFTFGR